ncbi:MAG: ABC transporter ATP-binding protein [Bacteroidota bacterium]
MIQLNGLGYQNAKKESILKEISIEFSAGKIYGLLGKNGAGKSTLIKNITGILFPTKGSCMVNGFTPQKREVAFLKNLFFVPEEYYLPDLSIQQLVKVYSKFYPNFKLAQFTSYLDTFDIPPTKKTSQLSLGQKKKVMIGFALSCNTDVLIMDEPTNGLDSPSKIIFRKIIKEAFRSDRIVLISSHQVRDLDELIDSILIMDNGKILFNETKAEISRKWKFNLSPVPSKDPEILYKEKVSNGYASISENTGTEAGYVDIELLFNAVLAKQLAPLAINSS